MTVVPKISTFLWFNDNADGNHVSAGVASC